VPICKMNLCSRFLRLCSVVPSSLYKLYTTQNSSIAHRGPVLWNLLISKDKNFSNTSYKNLKRETPSMDIFKELTLKETSTTSIIFRRKDFSIFRGF